MLFKNIQLYTLSEPFRYNAEMLDEKFSNLRTKPCAKSQLFTHGWISPFGKDHDMLIHTSDGRLLFAACKQEKIMPASVINDELDEKIEAIENAEQRKVSKKEKQSLRDEIIHTLLLQAFVKKKITYGYIDPEAQLLIIDTSNRNRAEEIISLIRESLGSFKVTPLDCNSNPTGIMTDWLLNNQCPPPFFIEQSCEMNDPKKENSVIKCQQQDLSTQEIRAHLTTGKQVTKLALSWEDKLSFVVNDDLSIKQIRYLDIFQDQRDGYDAETEAQKVDTDFTLMSGELNQMLEELSSAFDGFVTES